METQKQLTDLSVTEIKSHCYDCMAQIEQAQNTLRVLNEELRKRLQPAQNQGSVTPVDTVYTPNK